MDLPGFRNAPSLVYAHRTPAFFLDDETPTGGFFRDGRASSLEVQAQQPFISEFEMGNRSAAEVITRLQASPATLELFVAAFGAQVLADPDAALADIGSALSAYETEAAEFSPFSSKFDAWLAGEAQLSARELNGLALYNNPGKGNCTACHPSQAQRYSQHPLFTDFTYNNIGVPRSWNIAANLPGATSPVSGAALDYLPQQLNRPADAQYPYQTHAYELAAKIPTVLHQQPCYCYCDRMGHNSLHSCFENTHGAQCSTCLKELYYSYQQHKKGKTAAQIRAGIIKGEWKQIDLLAAATMD